MREDFSHIVQPQDSYFQKQSIPRLEQEEVLTDGGVGTNQNTVPVLSLNIVKLSNNKGNEICGHDGSSVVRSHFQITLYIL